MIEHAYAFGLTPSEAWTLAPCEIIRFLRARGEADLDRRYFVSGLTAMAFNNPRALADEVRAHQRAKRLDRARRRGDSAEELAELFRTSGHRVLEATTKGAE